MPFGFNPILAFGFANAAVLGWLAAAAAPILIHLWMKRVHRETPWAAVRFLQAAIKRHARRLRLQELLLLAIRTAIIVLVVLAASKPLLESLGGLVGAGVRTHRVMVIDATMSMRLKSDEGSMLDGSLIDRAKRLASDLVDQSNAGDQFSLVVMAGRPSAPVASATVDKAAVRRAIAGVEPTDAANDLPATMQFIDGLIEAAEKGPSAADRREVVFLSDATRSAWAPLTEGDAGATAKELFAKLADRAALSLIDVGADDAGNLAATSLRVDSGTPTLQEPVRFLGQIQSFGAVAGGREVTAELVVDGLAVASERVTLSGDAPATVEFRHRFRRPGWRRVTLRLPGDALAVDDERRLAVRLKEQIAVLCVEGRRDAARYVAEALNPGDAPEAPIQVRVISDAELAGVSLEGFDAVFLCNVAEFTEREAARLEAYVRSGGGATFFLGDRVRAERYNATLGRAASEQALRLIQPIPLAGPPRGPSETEQESAPMLLGPRGGPAEIISNCLFQTKAAEDSPVLPVTIGASVAQSQYGIDPLEYRHPIVAPFRGRERAGLLTTPVERYFRLFLPQESGAAQVALATAAGDPLMVTAPVGRGRVVVVATAGSLASIDPATNRPWTVMPAWPSFVPIIRETLRFAAGAASDRAETLVGEAIGDRLPPLVAGGAEVLRPDGSSEAAVVDDASRAWSYDRTDQAGFYTLLGEGGEETENQESAQLVAVNADPVESDTARLAPADLPGEIAVRRVAGGNRGAASDLAPPVGVHRGLLLSALGLVLLETWLAYRFGRAAA